jgi:flagellin-specific chaperone FliS
MSIDIIDMDSIDSSIKVIRDMAGKDEDFEQKCFRIVNTMDKIDECQLAIANMITKWDELMHENGIAQTEIPPVILDYIDEQIDSDKISTAADIIKLFESGVLKDIVKADDTIDRDAVAKFQKKIGKGQGKILKADDDVF